MMVSIEEFDLDDDIASIRYVISIDESRVGIVTCTPTIMNHAKAIDH